ncbi:MAG: hypothetical protein ACK4VI_07935 [Alphaproteobacteria bacterium]
MNSIQNKQIYDIINKLNRSYELIHAGMHKAKKYNSLKCLISKRSFAAFLALNLFSLAFLSLSAIAQPIPETCDSDYFDVLKAKSYVQGKREMEKAQRIILKPDSVLEYSCFHFDLEIAGVQAGRFSAFGMQTARGNPPEFDGNNTPTRVLPSSLANALSLVLHDSLHGFLDSFSHIYGGGTYPLVPNDAAGCNPMNIVWEASKCQNFDPRWWVTLEDLASRDIRQFPIPCAPDYDEEREELISAAYEASYPPPNTSGAMDRYESLSTRMNHDSCSASPVPTGMIAYYYDRPPQEERVCIQPGCYFNGSSCVPNS